MHVLMSWKTCHQFSGTMILFLLVGEEWKRENKKRLQPAFIWNLFMFYLGLDTYAFKDNRNPLCCSFMFFQFWQLLLSIERMPGHRSSLNCWTYQVHPKIPLIFRILMNNSVCQQLALTVSFPCTRMCQSREQGSSPLCFIPCPEVPAGQTALLLEGALCGHRRIFSHSSGIL